MSKSTKKEQKRKRKDKKCHRDNESTENEEGGSRRRRRGDDHGTQMQQHVEAGEAPPKMEKKGRAKDDDERDADDDHKKRRKKEKDEKRKKKKGLNCSCVKDGVGVDDNAGESNKLEHSSDGEACPPERKDSCEGDVSLEKHLGVRIVASSTLDFKTGRAGKGKEAAAPPINKEGVTLLLFYQYVEPS